jgi:butyryl-CoA dehydrogenase
MKVAEEQEILGAIADMVGRCFALDSVIARINQMPVEKSTLAKDLLAAYAPRAYGMVFNNARHILMDICDEKTLPGHLEAVGKLRLDWPAKVIAAKRRIAAAVVERGGYPF